MARLTQPLDPSGQLRANLPRGEHRIARLLQKIRTKTVNRAQRGAHADAIIQRQQAQTTGLAGMMDGYHHGNVTRGGPFLLTIGKSKHPIDIETESTQFTGLRQRLRGTHPSGKTSASLRSVRSERVIQPAHGILHHGMIDAISLIGGIVLFAGTRARDDGIRHRRARQGGHHKFASFGHKPNINTSGR